MEDSYTKLAGSKSSFFGATRIFYCGVRGEIMVFVMFYRGDYPEYVIQFLKDNLCETYADGVFEGGRGRNKKSWVLSYENKWEGSIAAFSGREAVLETASEKEVGFHIFVGHTTLTEKEIAESLELID